MKLLRLPACFSLFLSCCLGLHAQVCDPAVSPTGLTASYTPGSGALLEWDAVPGSQGVLILAVNPAGLNESRRIQSFELGQFLVPEARLSPGTYTWQIQAACSTIPPFDVTPVSASDTFTVGGGSTCPIAVMDIDGNMYPTVQIGSQCWMAANLQVERYNNGDNIPTGINSNDWDFTTTGAFEVYSDNPSNMALYGLLYNGYAVGDARGLCPVGWHVPTDEEWTQLTDFLGGSGTAGGLMKATGTLTGGTGLWRSPNTAATNSSGFSGLPGGYRGDYGLYLDLSFWGYWWSSTEVSAGSARNRELYYSGGDVRRDFFGKFNGFSVRCLQDE